MVHYINGPCRIEKMKLVAYAQVGGNYIDVPFEKEIIWNKHSESVIEFWHGGRLLKEGGAFNDYYGFMTSKEAAIESAKECAKAYGVDETSSLVIVVRTKIEETPYYKSQRCSASDVTDQKLRHEVEYAEGWRKLENQEPLQSVEISSEITWASGAL